MSIFLKLIYIFKAIPIKIPAGFTVEFEKLLLKFIWKCKGPSTVKTTLKKKNKVGGLTLFDYKAAVIKDNIPE